ncbi:Palmitoyl-acyl carrier protein thioesterase, chloroplastic [Sesamum angolense]|uniref:Acyl-[acyl-carrier-protein] hydrolase n=1 Tax=Sesamum angolense TaxID=2727404 RepID=A0AAE2BS72_9LAMI|nr:Palmitoyl-acyl carrier protein thioesterase, chloroplastic [Sesamum angolense]
MALMRNAALHFPKDLCHAERNHDTFGRVGCAGGTRRRAAVKMKASSKTNVDTVNGKKVNGVHVEGRIPFLDQRSAELLKDGESVYGAVEPNHEYLLGRFVEDRFVYRQSFVIRSYEIGPDKTATMETLMNLLQETALNHVASAGVAGNGFGATREMSIRKLIWVVTRIHVQVQKFSSWGDVVEIDTWVDAAGKNGMRRDWIIRDYNTQKIITRATSTWVIMNRETRRLSKIPEEVKNEVQPFYLNRAAIATENTDSEKIEKLTDETAEIIRTGLAPRWSDMDANQHVNNVKYIGWLLESNVLESLTSMKAKTGDEEDKQFTEGSAGAEDLECTHLLRMEADQAEIVRARSVWQMKQHDDNQMT